MDSDDKIIKRVLEGFTEDYRELMQRHQNSVFRLAWRILGRREDAEDVVQEAFLKAYSNLAGCRDRDKFWPWVRRIAFNICLRKTSRESTYSTFDDLLDSASENESPVEFELIRRLEISDLRMAVADLPVNYRTVLVLRYEEDMSYRDIAELINESTDVVRIRLHRAKKMLAEQLAVVRNEV